LKGGGQISPGREPGKDSLLARQSARCGDGIVIADLQESVDVGLRFQHGKKSHGVAAPLDAMIRTEYRLASENSRPGGLHNVTSNGWIVLFQRSSATSKRAACTDEIAKRIDSPAGLCKDFRPSVQQVCAVVATVSELVGSKRAALGHNPLGFDFHSFKVAAGNMTWLRVGQLVNQIDFGPQGGHHPCPFNRVALGHHGYERIASDRTYDGQPSPRVAASQLDDRLAGPQCAFSFGILDDLQSDAVFLR